MPTTAHHHVWLPAPAPPTTADPTVMMPSTPNALVSTLRALRMLGVLGMRSALRVETMALGRRLYGTSHTELRASCMDLTTPRPAHSVPKMPIPRGIPFPPVSESRFF